MINLFIIKKIRSNVKYKNQLAVFFTREKFWVGLIYKK